MISYRFRLHQNNQIESTVNTQPFSFSTPPSTVNSQQSTVNNHSGTTGIDVMFAQSAKIVISSKDAIATSAFSK
jgi:hypothetical protein